MKLSRYQSRLESCDSGHTNTNCRFYQPFKQGSPMLYSANSLTPISSMICWRESLCEETLFDSPKANSLESLQLRKHNKMQTVAKQSLVSPSSFLNEFSPLIIGTRQRGFLRTIETLRFLHSRQFVQFVFHLQSAHSLDWKNHKLEKSLPFRHRSRSSCVLLA